MTDTYRYEAEALAVPWATGAAFRRAETTISHSALRDELDARLQLHGGGAGAESWLRRVWPGQGGSLARALRAYARRLLAPGGEAMVLRTDGRELPDAILRWRFVSLRLPAGVLAAAASPRGARPVWRIRVLPPGSAPAEAVTLQHVHLMAACPFEALWTHVMSARRAPDVREVPAGFSDVETWLAVLGRARLARRWMDCVLRRRRDPRRREIEVDEIVRRALHDFAQGRPLARDRTIENALWRRALPSFPAVRSADLWSRDPIGDGCEWPEGRLAARAFDHVDDHPGGFFERVFVQYLRVKCILHAHLVHDPARRGLDFFADTFDRLSPYRDGLEDGWLARATIDEPELDLAAVELRGSPPARTRRVRQLAGVARRLTRETGLEVGLVFHLIRDLEAPRDDPERRPPAAQARAIRRSVRALRRALELRPRLLAEVRGLDVASREGRGPLWMALDPLRSLRALSRRLSARVGVPPLRLTLHAGEDFPHLLSGLRAIDEPFVWGLMEPGDRLGHGLALGLDPQRWCRRHARVLVPRIVRLLDLSWALDRLGSGGESIDAVTLHRLRQEHAALLAAFGLSADHGDLHARLGERGLVDRLMSASAGQPPAPVARLVWRLLHGDPAILRAWYEPTEVETALDEPLLAALQSSLACRLARARTVIEANPTSNLLIGGLDHPVDQPLFRLRPLDPARPEAVPVTISTDDPLQFATRLADEYAYAWAGAVAGGDPPGYAHAWLEESARTSRASRFTVGQKLSDRVIRSAHAGCGRSSPRRR